MALLDWIGDVPGPVITGESVRLRPPRLSDHADWARLRLESRAYLQPWEPTWPDDDLGRAAYRRRLSIYAREMELGNAWPMFIFDRNDKGLRGAVTLSNVRRGVASMGTLGYWVAQRHAGQGYATQAVRALCQYAFEQLKLHRVEAACVPGNIASQKVLERSGFELEGKARAYLKINGVWADHLLYGRISDLPDSG